MLLKAYFDHIHPFSPVLERVDFMTDYHSGNHSLFLLHAVLAVATMYVSEQVLAACGFPDRAAAQASFFSKANLLHDFNCERDPLVTLQGSIILGGVVLAHPTERDYRYWFPNSIRLAVQLNIHSL